mgnify:CR=1 FL=1
MLNPWDPLDSLDTLDTPPPLQELSEATPSQASPDEHLMIEDRLIEADDSIELSLIEPSSIEPSAIETSSIDPAMNPTIDPLNESDPE